MIIGTGFADGATVTFGGVAATSVVVHDSNHISCVTGAHAAGVVDIVVTNPDTQTGTLASGFTYTAAVWTDGEQLVQQETSPGPDWTALLNSPNLLTITGISPDHGPITGYIPDIGAVIISGTGFISWKANGTVGIAVTFDGSPGIGVQVPNSKQIEVIPPAHASGAVVVIVTNADSQQAATVFTYDNVDVTLGQGPSTLPLSFGSISPNIGTTAGGDTLTILGNNFVDPVTVIIGNLYATNVTVVNSQKLTCVTPLHSKGTFDVTVVNS